MRIVLFIFALWFIPTVANARGDWRWIRIEPSERAGWQTLSGDADVEFAGSSFSVTLNKGNFPAYKVTGKIDGRKIRATEIVLNTDADPLTYTGFIERIRTPRTAPSRGWGSDRIVLTSGPWFIGLHRSVRP
jgi:hypothetical protein